MPRMVVGVCTTVSVTGCGATIRMRSQAFTGLLKLDGQSQAPCEVALRRRGIDGEPEAW